MTRLIGLGGALRAGKDTVADYLVEHHGFTKVGMSDPLLKAMMKLDPIIDARYGDRFSDVINDHGYTQAKSFYPEVRRLLQVFGTEVSRDLFGEDVWVDAMKRTVLASGDKVVVSGIRFPNEVKAIESLGGQTWWVSRPGFEGDGHASETSVSEADFMIAVRNAGTLDSLHDLVRGLL